MTQEIAKATSQEITISQKRDSVKSLMALTDSRTLSLSEVIQGDSTIVGFAKKHLNKDLRTFVLKEINRACNVIDANKTIKTEAEMSLTLDDLIDECHYMRIQEIRICFDKMIRGDFGKFYERFKHAEVIQCFKEYSKERVFEIEKNRIKKLNESIEEIQSTAEEIRESLKGYEHKPVFKIKGDLKKNVYVNLTEEEVLEIDNLKANHSENNKQQ